MMDGSIVFYLLSAERTQDALRQWTETPARRKVFGQLSSVTGSEFFAAGQNGIKPEYRVRLFAPDYQGEREIEYAGQVYSIYRTYQARGNVVELYLERRAGDGNG